MNKKNDSPEAASNPVTVLKWHLNRALKEWRILRVDAVLACLITAIWAFASFFRELPIAFSALMVVFNLLVWFFGTFLIAVAQVTAFSTPNKRPQIAAVLEWIAVLAVTLTQALQLTLVMRYLSA